ncbi:MAG: biopolymer transporter ExbD, partial [Candidatus Sericytochromatia bacterium]
MGLMFRETRKHKPRKIHFEIIPMIDVMMILVLFLSVMAFLPQVQSAIQTDLPESGSDNEV